MLLLACTRAADAAGEFGHTTPSAAAVQKDAGSLPQTTACLPQQQQKPSQATAAQVQQERPTYDKQQQTQSLLLCLKALFKYLRQVGMHVLPGTQGMHDGECLQCATARPQLQPAKEVEVVVVQRV
jgi:hypothetical protein